MSEEIATSGGFPDRLVLVAAPTAGWNKHFLLLGRHVAIFHSLGGNQRDRPAFVWTAKATARAFNPLSGENP